MHFSYRLLVIPAWLGLVFVALAQDTVIVTIHSNIASATFTEPDGVSHTSISNISNIVKTFVPAHYSLEPSLPEGTTPLAGTKVPTCILTKVFESKLADVPDDDLALTQVLTAYLPLELPWLILHLTNDTKDANFCAELSDKNE